MVDAGELQNHVIKEAFISNVRYIFMHVILKDLFRKYEEIISYLIVGGLTTIVSLGTYYFCVITFLSPHIAYQLQLANFISWVAAVTFAYFVSRKFVFKSQTKNKGREAISFYSSRVITLLMDMLIMYIMVTLCKVNDKLAKVVVQIVVTIANYIFSKKFVFRSK